MKQSIIYFFLATLVLFGCRKEDSPKIPDLIRVPTPALTLDSTSDKFISPIAPASFKAKFTVDVLFANETPQKFDVVAMKNGNPGNVKVMKADITTFPTKVEITGQELINQFGAISGGDKFVFGINITNKNGQLITAFPPSGVGATAYASGVVTEMGAVKPGATTTLQFLMPCPFVASAYAGNFEVVLDEWQDYTKGTVIPVKVVSPTQLSFVYAVDAGTAKPIILTINPADNSITVAKQEYGSYGGDKYSVESVSSPSNIVNPCDLSLSVRLKHSTTGFSGNYTITLKKK